MYLNGIWNGIWNGMEFEMEFEMDLGGFEMSQNFDEMRTTGNHHVTVT
jgi:hypothetical protein